MENINNGDVTLDQMISDKNFDYMFKIMLIGNSGVGKTSFLLRFCDNQYSENFITTVGIDFKVKTISRHGRKIKLQIWDTAGQERYKSITTAYYRGAMGFIIVYDINNEASFISVHQWAVQIRTHGWEHARMILVGNKCELHSGDSVPSEDARSLAEQLRFSGFYECSARENVNVHVVFEHLIDSICERMAETQETDPTEYQIASNNQKK